MDRYLATPAESTWRLPLSLPPEAERTLLIADDDISSSRAMGLVFTDHGFLVEFAHTGSTPLRSPDAESRLRRSSIFRCRSATVGKRRRQSAPSSVMRFS
jgi:hypothetical protein